MIQKVANRKKVDPSLYTKEKKDVDQIEVMNGNSAKNANEVENEENSATNSRICLFN